MKVRQGCIQGTIPLSLHLLAASSLTRWLHSQTRFSRVSGKMFWGRSQPALPNRVMRREQIGALCEPTPVHSFGYGCTFELLQVRVLLSVAAYEHRCLCLFVNLFSFLLGVLLGWSLWVRRYLWSSVLKWLYFYSPVSSESEFRSSATFPTLGLVIANTERLTVAHVENHTIIKK